MGVLTLVEVAAALLLAVLLARMVRVFWRLRGARMVTCPENQKAAGVTVAAGRVAAKSLIGTPKLDLASCSRWPEKAGCGQDCLSQVQDSPENCLIRNILLRWYAGKSCASCGQAFHDIPPAGAQPAVLRADMVSVDWSEIPVEHLTETLSASSPICFACHMGNTLVREHPALVVDRQRPVDRPKTQHPGRPN